MGENTKHYKPYAFIPGCRQVSVENQKALKSDIMVALGITSDIGYLQRRRGDVIPRVPEAEAIERIFARYGVKSKIWGHEVSKQPAD